ncbi:GTP cyclohydrolase II [Thalassomonas viridans]|uniref:GTP cyclohydrolase-2 n=1 Tax=Thalassomonas viridans TaxID=137584 RepID=A0AAE9Z5J8_9GAMM|nr:GTP cyclohydrolase II [Thalassomonas viridans]WDE07008.1 GTP cyclohydrolase II [Thalassomonas viridans]
MVSVRNSVVIPVGEKQTHEAKFVSFHGLSDGKEHIALVFKEADSGQAVPLVRLHSECLTGDVFHSARCDCGQQLDEAIELMAQKGGILLYLRQEGRGIGLYNKLDAYSLQDTGLNTFEANNALGFENDLRDFSIAAQMLQALGVTEIDLLTNNPEKVATIEQHNVKVRRQQTTGVFYNRHNGHYLAAKAEVAKHHIDLRRQNKLAS